MLAALYAPRHWTFKVQTVNGDANYMYMYSYHLGIGSLINKIEIPFFLSLSLNIHIPNNKLWHPSKLSQAPLELN